MRNIPRSRTLHASVALLLVAFPVACKKTAPPPPQVAQPAAVANPASTAAQEVAFIQSFYDWYDPIVHDDTRTTTAPSAIEQHPEFFDAPLLAALRANNIATAKAASASGQFKPILARRLCCLAYDPFGYGDSMDDIHYKAVRAYGDHVIARAGINGVPDAFQMDYEVRCDPARCVIVNAFYHEVPSGDQPGVPDSNLLSDLHKLQSSR